VTTTSSPPYFTSFFFDEAAACSDRIIHFGFVGPGLTKKKRKKICWAEIGPLFSGFVPGTVIWAGPTHVF
jgi:hypothetical protein